MRMSTSEITPQDQQLLELLNAEPTVEAIEWLERPRVSGEKRVIGAGGSMLEETAALALVRDLYRAGADEVCAVNTVQEAGADDHADGLLIVLPNGEEPRARLFELVYRQAQALGREPTRDDGQRYALMSWV